MASGGNQPDAPPPSPPHAPPQPEFSANDHHLYPANLPQIDYPSPYSVPQLLSTGVHTTPFYPAPAPPVNPYAAPYGYQIPVPPTYQVPNLVYGGIGAADLSTGQTAAADASVAGVEKKTNGSKKAPKKLKAVQSWFCDICKVDCNRKSILDQHKTGKKHRKNLEKMVAANRTAILPASADSGSQLIGPQENPVKGKVKEDLGAKTNKLLKGGAAADSVRVCAICNVVANSETVFKTHLAGQKHAKELKKHSSA